MGSSLAAFIAGHIPNKSPIDIETLRPTMGAQDGIALHEIS
jgi:hypothetical protein